MNAIITKIMLSLTLMLPMSMTIEKEKDFKDYFAYCEKNCKLRYFVMYSNDTLDIEMEISFMDYCKLEQAGFDVEAICVPTKPTFKGFIKWLKERK